MPSYTYNCPRCEWLGTLLAVPISERDEQTCPNLMHMATCDLDESCTCEPTPCGELLEREEIPETQRGKVDYRHQTKAILTDGTKVAGHFGKTASINKGRY